MRFCWLIILSFSWLSCWWRSTSLFNRVWSSSIFLSFSVSCWLCWTRSASKVCWYFCCKAAFCFGSSSFSRLFSFSISAYLPFPKRLATPDLMALPFSASSLSRFSAISLSSSALCFLWLAKIKSFRSKCLAPVSSLRLPLSISKVSATISWIWDMSSAFSLKDLPVWWSIQSQMICAWRFDFHVDLSFGFS